MRRQYKVALVLLTVAFGAAWLVFTPSVSPVAVPPPRPDHSRATDDLRHATHVPPEEPPRATNQAPPEVQNEDRAEDTGGEVRPAGWPQDLPGIYLPAAVEEAAREAEEICFSDTSTQLEVDCSEFPCLVVAFSRDGVVFPFCAESDGPAFPDSWTEVGSPISLALNRFTKVQPMAPEAHLTEPELRERIREREWLLTKDWVKGRE